MKVMKWEVTALCILLLAAACNNDNFSKYKHLAETEPASGKHADTLFQGIYLGMTSREFYGHCWQLNKAGLFTDGQNNNAVLYPLRGGELKHEASMNFYPEFSNDKIYKMRVTINYDAWAPWNKSMMSDSLQNDVLALLQTWYPAGNPFLKIEDKDRGTIYVKVDGNRRIVMGRFDDMRVKVDYTDLRVEEAMKQ